MLGQARPGWLHDEVDVTRGPAGVGPQADVGLLGLGDLLNAGGRSSQQRAEFFPIRNRGKVSP